MFTDLPTLAYSNPPAATFKEYFSFGRKPSNVSTTYNDSSPTLVNVEIFDSSFSEEYWRDLVRRIFNNFPFINDDRFSEEYQYNIVTSNTLHDLYNSNIRSIPFEQSILNFHEHIFRINPLNVTNGRGYKFDKFIPTIYGQLKKLVHNEYLIRRTLNANHIIIAIYRTIKKLSRLKNNGRKRTRIVAIMLILIYLSFQQEQFYVQHSQYEVLTTLKKTLASMEQMDDQLNQYQLRFKELAIFSEDTLHDYLTNCYRPTDISLAHQELRKTAELTIAVLDSLFYKLQYSISQILVACNMEKLSSICHIYGVHVNELEVAMSAGVTIEGDARDDIIGEKSRRVQLLKKFLLCCLLSIERTEYNGVSDILKRKELGLDRLFGVELDNVTSLGQNCWKLRLITEVLGNLQSFLSTLIALLKEHSYVLRRTLSSDIDGSFERIEKALELKRSLHGVYLTLLTLEKKVQKFVDIKRKAQSNGDDYGSDRLQEVEKEEDNITTKLCGILELWKRSQGCMFRESYAGSYDSGTNRQIFIDEVAVPSGHSSPSTNYKYIQRNNQLSKSCVRRSKKTSMGSGFSLDVLKPSTYYRSSINLNERINLTTIDTEIDDISSSDDESGSETFKYIFPKKSQHGSGHYSSREEKEQQSVWTDFLLLSGNRGNSVKLSTVPTDSQLQNQLQSKLFELALENKAQKYETRTKKSLELLRDRETIKGHQRHRHGDRALQDILKNESCLATEKNIPLFYLQEK